MTPVVQIESLTELASDSERTLLGLLLLESHRFPEVELAVSDFGLSTHRETFTAMNRLHGDGESWDSISLIGSLRSDGKLDAAGGAAFLSDLTSDIPKHMAVSNHVKRVREASCRRKAEKLLQDGLDATGDATVDTVTLLGDMATNLQSLLNGFDEKGNALPYSLGTSKVGRSPELVCLSDVQPRDVDWLWEPYLPAGMLAMLSGDPGGGKTFLALAVAAALSNGKTPFTLEPRKPVNTLYLSVENSPEHVVRPRFDSLGGDAKRFHFIQGSISLKDVDRLRDFIAKTEAGLLVVDPIQSYLGADVDAHRSNETRPVLDGLARLASEYKCCCLLVRHLSKASGGRAITRGLGSIDLTGAVRTELMAGNEADNPNSRALVQIKSNLGRFGDSLGFTIGAEGFTWTGKSNLTPSDLLAPEGDAETRTEIASAEEYLKSELAGGPKRQTELVACGDFTTRTLQRAAKKMGVNRGRNGERGAVIWSLT
jgi:hypothetical protein